MQYSVWPQMSVVIVGIWPTTDKCGDKPGKAIHRHLYLVFQCGGVAHSNYTFDKHFLVWCLCCPIARVQRARPTTSNIESVARISNILFLGCVATKKNRPQIWPVLEPPWHSHSFVSICLWNSCRNLLELYRKCSRFYFINYSNSKAVKNSPW